MTCFLIPIALILHIFEWAISSFCSEHLVFYEKPPVNLIFSSLGFYSNLLFVLFFEHAFAIRTAGFPVLQSVYH